MQITISGLPGSGKSTVAKKLVETIGYDYYSIGSLMREIAEEKGVSLHNLSLMAESDFSIDKELDEKQKKLKNKDDFIVDSRLGFHFISN